MAAALIDGKAAAADIRAQVAEGVALLKCSHGITPGLAVVLVGADPASQVYVRNKARQTAETGMASHKHELDADVAEEKLLSLIARLNADPEVHGILVQLPLPKHIDASSVINAIDPAKDVDGFTISNVGMLTTGQDALVPCTPLGWPLDAAPAARFAVRNECGDCRPLEYCRQADGKPAVARTLHGHCGPQPNP